MGLQLRRLLATLFQIVTIAIDISINLVTNTYEDKLYGSLVPYPLI